MGRYTQILLLLICALCTAPALAQMPNSNMPQTPVRDTSMNKSNTNKWREDEANVYFVKMNSDKVYYPDTAIHTFHRAMYLQPWYRDLGNLGGPINNLLFTPEQRTGPSLGYHIYDAYRFNPDSAFYYNTRRPYSVFHYQLGSKLEQTAGILHTQNITPYWNFSAAFNKTTSPGFFKTQRNNNDNASFTTWYVSPGKHYTLHAAMAYNKEQTDENGGIVNDSELTDPVYVDRRTVDAAYQNSAYSITRSPVTNTLRDFTGLLQHSYTFGRTDTLYNTDSTQYELKLIPRFSITHRMGMGTEKHTYKDLSPDSLRYTSLFDYSFTNKGTGYYTPGGDSVFTQQKWFWIDNAVLLGGYLGRADKPLKFSAGIGNRYDQFTSVRVASLIPDSLPKKYYYVGNDRSRISGNYVAGEIRKEALTPGQWEYGVDARLFVTGDDAGDFSLSAVFGKQLKNRLGGFTAGFRQQLSTAPYSYTNYENLYTRQIFGFDKESVTTLYATLESPRLGFAAGVRNYVTGNYIYINEAGRPDQDATTFSITQVWARKVFRLGDLLLDNELVLQQVPDNAPVNAPPVMGRHQLSYERGMFKRRLKIATGVEVRYNTAYNPAGYSALLNKFFYQGARNISNVPEASVFLNFRVKRFRAFVMLDNLQQLFAKNAILYTATPVANFGGSGINYTPVYAAPDVLIRFGFNWVMVN